MEVILKEDYLPLGYIGDKVSVRGGFARNFLLPRGVAVEASGRNARMLNHQLSAIIAKRVKRKGEAEAFGAVLQQVTVEFTLKMGEQGKSYGSVTTKDIEASLKALGYEVNRKQIRIPEQIRAAGTYQIEVKLHSEVVIPVQVKVTAAQPTPILEAKDDEEGADRRGKGKKRAPKKKADEEGAETPTTEETSPAAE